MKKNKLLCLILCLSSFSVFAETNESRVFTKKGNGSTYLSQKSGCNEALDRAVSNAKNACYTAGFTECNLVSTKVISEKQAYSDGSFDHLGTCSFEATVNGTSLDVIKESDELERRI